MVRLFLKLYGLLIGSIALFAAAISESSATAAIIVLAVTIGSWVLDFTAAGHSGMLGWQQGDPEGSGSRRLYQDGDFRTSGTSSQSRLPCDIPRGRPDQQRAQDDPGRASLIS